MVKPLRSFFRFELVPLLSRRSFFAPSPSPPPGAAGHSGPGRGCPVLLRIDLNPSASSLPAESVSHAASGRRLRSRFDRSGRYRLLYVMVLLTIHMMTLRHSTLEAGRASDPL